MGPSPQSQTVSLLGCGWLGLPLAHALIERGWHVRGSTTQAGRLSLLASLGVEPILLRVDGAFTGSVSGCGEFFNSDVLVINIPPEISLGPDYHLGQIDSILKMVSPSVRQVVYVSSTSVYGASQGAVDETVEPSPDGESGAVLLRAEGLLIAFCVERGVGLTIVRPGGLVGPGRHPGLFLAGRKNLSNGSAPVNMIHQLELTQWISALITEHPVAAGSREIYNAVSPHHPTREDFYVRSAGAIGVEAPTFARGAGAAGDSAIAAAAGKIVLSDKIRRVTALAPKYRDLYEAIGVT